MRTKTKVKGIKVKFVDRSKEIYQEMMQTDYETIKNHFFKEKQNEKKNDN